ncbi:PH domain-containing protein [Cellulomonas sp. HZM]|uniref:PH domain-containing protein n=1 Tax=Cellulomonas sp. HZM TaxID=1454010 RepID=UPI000492FF91|nr:PH domain-containing protein [Cellulomonas sp. HZM]
MTEPSLAAFRPRLARFVTLALAVVVVLGTVALLLAVPDLTAGDRLGFVLVAGLIVWFLWRQATVSAVPSEDGLVVRNLLVTTRLEWAQVVAVRFGHGNPWVQLDLDDGDTLAVMGVQRADGVRAQDEAQRLSTLVARFTATPRDD